MGTRVGGRRAVLIAAGAVSLLLSTAGCALTSPKRDRCEGHESQPSEGGLFGRLFRR
jgi:hypothetical protein